MPELSYLKVRISYRQNMNQNELAMQTQVIFRQLQYIGSQSGT